jgi:hypothetical protein
LFSQTGNVGLWRERVERAGAPARELFYFELEHAVFRVDPEAGQIVGLIAPCTLKALHLLVNTYALFPLLLLLRSRGIYHLRAAAVVSPRDRLWLICGSQRVGRTTLTTALGMAGWRPLSDDSLLISFDGLAARVTAFKKDSRIEAGLAAGRAAWCGQPPDGRSWNPGPWRNRGAACGWGGGDPDLFETAEAADAGFDRVDYLVLPQLVKTPESRLVPVAASEALLRLAEQSLFFQLWREHAERQWRTLMDLARSASCYRLYSGSDLLDRPPLAAEILERV